MLTSSGCFSTRALRSCTMRSPFQIASDVDPEVSQVAEIGLKAFVQQRLAIAIETDDAHVEARPKIGNDALEVIERPCPSTVDKVMLLIALRAIDAAGSCTS